MKLSFINKSICLIILIILIDIQPTVSIVRMAVKRLSLYKKNDKVVVLARQNFTSTVYKSPTAWLVQFYASWCGHCQSYANVRYILQFFHILSNTPLSYLFSIKLDLSRNCYRYLA